MAAYESMVLLSLLFVKKYANQKADIFLQNGKETAQFEKQKTTLSGGFRFVIVHRLCCPHTLRIPQGRGSVRGKPLRVSLFAGGHFCAAKVQLQKRRDTRTCVSSFLELLGGFEPPTSSLPIIEKLLQLVVGYCAFSHASLYFQWLRDFSCCVLLFSIIA